MDATAGNEDGMPNDEDTVEPQEATEESQPQGPNWKAIGIIGGSAVLGLVSGGCLEGDLALCPAAIR